MGSEAACRVRFSGQAGEGKALLETTELIFRGDFRLRILFKDISALEVEDGELRIDFSQGEAVFELGPQAEAWAAKIRNPRGLLDKLGIKDGDNVAVIGVEDADFLADLRQRARVVEALEPGLDWVFYAADQVDDLLRLPELAASLQPKGGIWVVSRKGKAATLKDVEVMAAAREAGLVDNKVASFSDTHTALKLVIPVALRR